MEIYALIDPDTNKIRYIGKAADSQKRLKTHLRDSRGRNYPVYIWIRQLLSERKIPIVQVLAVVGDNDWPQEERKIIDQYKKTCDLLNVATGGKEPFCSKEQREINGRNNAKSIHSDPNRKRKWYLMKMIMTDLACFKKRGWVEQYNGLLAKLKTRPDVFIKAATMEFMETEAV